MEEAKPNGQPVKKERLSRLTKKRLSQGALAFGFVVVTLLAWWFFASLAETVVKCVPWKVKTECTPLTDPATIHVGVRVSMLIVSLIAAIWVAQRLFYTADTYQPTHDPALRPGAEKQ